VGFWLGVVIVGMVIQLVARRSDGRVADASELIRFITGPPVANITVVLAWTVAGYHLFAR
jgi:hypothetical protein